MHRNSKDVLMIRNSSFKPRTPTICVDESTEDKTTYAVGELDRRVLAAGYYRHELMSEFR